ncbi:hypothetical protein [Rhodanobacter sp. FW106-PBR-R2A-1-13]|uniref:hypothetical protein n=1 Tax=Rhodanobacter sp. FW106-PBR-R2A-1-13 TaxID=3454845 RepID=UPI0034E50D6A
MTSTTSPTTSRGQAPLRVNAASATLPGIDMIEAVSRIHAGLVEPALGVLATDHIQLCPQNSGTLDEALCEALRARWPATQFRPHANVRVLPRLRVFDASTAPEQATPLLALVADRCRRLTSPAYTIHAGYREHATLAQMLDNVRRLQDVFPCPVGVEGLYPREDKPQLMDGWAEYEAVMASGVPLAIDLSHLQIVAQRQGRHDDLVRALLASPTTIEVHLSGNDGRRDSHEPLSDLPWWWPLLDAKHPGAVVFSEGNQLRPTRSTHPRSLP